MFLAVAEVLKTWDDEFFFAEDCEVASMMVKNLEE